MLSRLNLPMFKLFLGILGLIPSMKVSMENRGSVLEFSIEKLLLLLEGSDFRQSVDSKTC